MSVMYRWTLLGHVVAVSLCALALSASAATPVWDNQSTDATWVNPLNWNPDGEPGSADDVTLPTPVPVSGATITLTAGRAANSLTVNDVYTLTAGSLTLTTSSIHVDGSGASLTVDSILDGAAGLAKTGAGTLHLNNTANTFTGNIQVSAGALAFAGNAAADPTALGTGAKTITLTNNAILRPTTSSDPTAATKSFVIGTGGGTIDTPSGVTLTLNDAGQLSGSTTLTKTGAGTLVIGKTSLNANDLPFTGAINLTTGAIQVGENNVASVRDPLTNSNVSFNLSSGTTVTFFHNSTISGLTGSGVVQVGNDFSGATSKTLNVNIASDNTFSGTFRDDDGLHADASLTKNGVGKLTFHNATVTIGRAITVGNGELVYSGTTANTGSAVSDRQRLVINQGAAFTLDNTATNNTNRIQLNSGTTNGNGYFVLTGGTFNFLGNSSAASSETFGTASTLAQNPSFNTGLDTINIVAGAGQSAILTSERNIVRNAGASVVFQGTNLGGARGAADTATFAYNTSGPTQVGGGGAAGSSTINIMPGVFANSIIGGNDTWGLATYDNGANAAVGGGDDIGVRRLAAGEMDSNITDGQVTLTNVRLTAPSNLITVATTINSLHVDAAASIDGAGALTVSSGTILAAGGVNGGIGTTTPGTLAFGATEAVFHTVSDLTVASTISGTVGLTKSGAGALVLAASNSYTGATTVNQGTLRLSAADRIANAATMVLSTGTFDTNGFSETLGTLNLAGTSSIDLGDGSSVLQFGASNGVTWTSARVLNILDWSGLMTGGGTDRVLFGSTSGGLTATQLGMIRFINPDGFGPGTYPAAILSTGEVVPVPEPATGTFIVGGALLLLARRARRR